MQETDEIKHIKSIQITDPECTFSETLDHSKWAISVNKDWVFIGDLNRMHSQKNRGGGGILIRNNKQLWKAFNKLGNCDPKNYD